MLTSLTDKPSTYHVALQSWEYGGTPLNKNIIVHEWWKKPRPFCLVAGFSGQPHIGSPTRQWHLPRLLVAGRPPSKQKQRQTEPSVFGNKPRKVKKNSCGTDTLPGTISPIVRNLIFNEIQPVWCFKSKDRKLPSSIPKSPLWRALCVAPANVESPPDGSEHENWKTWPSSLVLQRPGKSNVRKTNRKLWRIYQLQNVDDQSFYKQNSQSLRLLPRTNGD